MTWVSRWADMVTTVSDGRARRAEDQASRARSDAAQASLEASIERSRAAEAQRNSTLTVETRALPPPAGVPAASQNQTPGSGTGTATGQAGGAPSGPDGINDYSGDPTSGFNSKKVPMRSGGQPLSTVDKRVRIRPRETMAAEIYGSGPMSILSETNGIIFPYTPTITYKQNPLWQNQDLTHSIQQYYYFTATESAEISITGRFTVQNAKEGRYMLAVFHFLRSYSKMHFGVSDPKRGLPPPILILDGYGDYMFNQLPIIIRQWNMDFPNDVDYIRVSTGSAGGGQSGGNSGYAYLPASTNITISAIVQRPPNTLKHEFDLQRFRNGELMRGFT